MSNSSVVSRDAASLAPLTPLEIQRLGRTRNDWRHTIRRFGGIEHALQALNGAKPQQKTPPSKGGASGRTAIRQSAKDYPDMKVSELQRQPELAISPDVRPLEHIIREGRLVVTPALARRILANANYERQRPVTAPHVAFLADEMRRGSFMPGTQIAFARMGDQLILVNGQHRLTSQHVCEETVEYQVVIHEAVTADDVHRLYYRHDRGQKVRSEAEVLAAAGVADKYGISKTVARAVFQAQPLIANRFLRPNLNDDPTLRNDDLRLEGCKPWWALAARFENIIAPAPSVVRKKLTSSQALAVALVTLKYQPEKAADFWGGVAQDDGLRRNDPRKALLIDFANREQWARKSSDGAVVTSVAWNAFFSGRPLSLVKIVNGAGIRIAGTPFDGRRR